MVKTAKRSIALKGFTNIIYIFFYEFLYAATVFQAYKCTKQIMCLEMFANDKSLLIGKLNRSNNFRHLPEPKRVKRKNSYSSAISASTEIIHKLQLQT